MVALLTLVGFVLQIIVIIFYVKTYHYIQVCHSVVVLKEIQQNKK